MEVHVARPLTFSTRSREATECNSPARECRVEKQRRAKSDLADATYYSKPPVDKLRSPAILRPRNHQDE